MKQPEPGTFVNSTGSIGVRPAGSTAPPAVFQRDFAHAMPMIFKNATILTELAFNNPDLKYSDEELKKYYMEALDTVSQFYIRMYADCRQNNMTGLAGWNEIFKYMKGADAENEEERWARREVFGMFNSFVSMSLFSYMFGSKSMAVSSPESLDESCYTIEIFLSLLSVMEDDNRKKMLADIRKFGLINPQVDLAALYKEGKKYLEKIKDDQEKRYGKSTGIPPRTSK